MTKSITHHMTHDTTTIVPSLNTSKNLMSSSPIDPSFLNAIPKATAYVIRPRIFIPSTSEPLGTCGVSYQRTNQRRKTSHVKEKQKSYTCTATLHGNNILRACVRVCVRVHHNSKTKTILKLCMHTKKTPRKCKSEYWVFGLIKTPLLKRINGLI